MKWIVTFGKLLSNIIKHNLSINHAFELGDRSIDIKVFMLYFSIFSGEKKIVHHLNSEYITKLGVSWSKARSQEKFI